MDFLLFMFSNFLNDSVLECLCGLLVVIVYRLTLALLKMCAKMAKIYGNPSSMRNFCFLKEKVHS